MWYTRGMCNTPTAVATAKPAELYNYDAVQTHSKVTACVVATDAYNYISG